MINRNTQALQALGQSLWLDNITRDMLADGTLARYIAELSVTGLTSNPTIFEHAIGHGSFYDEAIARLSRSGEPEEELFFALALEDLTTAADLFRPVFDATDGLDGWVSLEVSPLLSDNSAKTTHAAARLHKAADRPNLFIKIPGTAAGAEAIEESIFGGVPVNVTRSSPASSISRPPRPTCAASNAASGRIWTRTCARWPRCSSAAGTWR